MILFVLKSGKFSVNISLKTLTKHYLSLLRPRERGVQGQYLGVNVKGEIVWHNLGKGGSIN